MPNTVEFLGCDILYHKHRGKYSKDMTFGAIYDLAIQHNCKIILKNGKNGMWYIKGDIETVDELKMLCQINAGKKRNSVVTTLIM
jgi:hypothetical protein